MLLLYPLQNIFKTGYYEFTFHYASTLSCCRRRKSESGYHLHSIMLLLYLRFATSCSSDALFTFHYASTLSRPYILLLRYIFYLHSIMLLLYRRSNIWYMFIRIDLHSIMLLLYPLLVRRFHTEDYIYIPLCFYFIGRWFTDMQTAIKFTFHYASTLSVIKDKALLPQANLHSIMLLLYLALISFLIGLVN